MNKKLLQWPVFLTASVFVFGMSLTAWSFTILHEYSRQQLTTEIKRRYEAKAEQLQERINIGLESLTSIAALYSANDSVSRKAFNAFVHTDAAFHIGTIALGWVPRITNQSRDDFLKKARLESSPTFRIFEVSGHGMPNVSIEHNDYYPVYHLVSLYGERLQEGMNLASVPSKWQAMKKAVTQKTISITRRIQLYHGSGQYGFQAFLPLPATGEDDYDDLSSISGFATGLFDIYSLMDAVFSGEQGWDITLLDVSARRTAQVLYRSEHVSEEHSEINNIEQLEDFSEPYWSRLLNAGDRQWLAVFRPSLQSGMISHSNWMPYAGVVAGLFITSIISLYLFLAQIRGRLLFQSLRKVEEERELKNAAVQETLSKSRFLRAASHDLRQPLNTLSLYIDLIEKAADDGGNRGQMINRIKISIKSMNEMFNALLDLSQLEAGQLQPKVCNFHIQDLLQKISEEYSEIAFQKDIKFNWVYCSGIITSDPMLLERILRNYLNNAIAYTESGTVLLGCRRKAGELQIQVIDTGPGFDEKAGDSLFNEFYRGVSSNSSADKGLGLGLSIVSNTAKLLGHSYGFRSVQSKGSLFFITIPHEEQISS